MQLLDFLTGFYETYSVNINRIGINALLALSIYITLECGVLSLASAAFLGIGAYTAALLTLHRHLPFGVSIVAAGVSAALVSAPVSLPALRLKGVFLAIATIGFGEAVRIFFVNWSFAGGALGLVGIPQLTDWWQIYLSLGCVLFVFWRIRRSRMGYALAAIRHDELTARTMGINTSYYKLVTFVLGAFIAGIAGALQAHLFLIVDPKDFGFARATEILTYAVIGGTQIFLGPVFGAALITLLPEVLRNLAALGISPGAVRQFVNGLILLLVILFLPGGLITLPETVRRILARRETAEAERV